MCLQPVQDAALYATAWPQAHHPKPDSALRSPGPGTGVPFMSRPKGAHDMFWMCMCHGLIARGTGCAALFRHRGNQFSVFEIQPAAKLGLALLLFGQFLGG